MISNPGEIESAILMPFACVVDRETAADVVRESRMAVKIDHDCIRVIDHEARHGARSERDRPFDDRYDDRYRDESKRPPLPVSGRIGPYEVCDQEVNRSDRCPERD